MLLYSTMLPIKDTVSKDDFVRLAIEWNQGSNYDKIENLEWNGEYNEQYENNEQDKVFEIRELRANNIVAVRFKKNERGIIWTTDFILNFDEHALSIRLDREATESAGFFVNKFKPPYFVKLLVKRGFLDTDDELELSNECIGVSTDNYKIIEKVILGVGKHKLPIVYVTKTPIGNDPIDTDKLARELQGTAHVLVEEDNDVSKILKETCYGMNPYYGWIAVYYPGNSYAPRKIDSKKRLAQGDDLIYRITKTVNQFMTQQVCSPLFTWEGVQSEIYRIRYESKKLENQKVQREHEEWIEEFDSETRKLETENNELRLKIRELNNQISALKAENQGIKAKLEFTDNVPILVYGTEGELYESEIREIVLDVLYKQIDNEQENSRRRHIFEDILENNDFQRIPDKKKEQAKVSLKGYKTLTSGLKQNLEELGFEIESDGKHYKLVYYGDPRYIATMSKTGSDYRAGSNLAALLSRDMF